MSRVPETFHPSLETFIDMVKEVLGRRLLRVYMCRSYGDVRLVEDIVVLVEHREWEEELTIRKEAAGFKDSEGFSLSPLVVDQAKWEHWRRLGKKIVGRVEEQGILLYDREKCL